jgi:metal-responsive CopG/Arc/MetJ family transcriptional regulator
METVNISLPEKLNQQITRAMKNEGYASRSEFFRTLIRLYFALKATDRTQQDSFFTPFEKKSLSKVKKDLSSTGQYSSAFINSVVKGLGKSSLYNKK